MKSKSIRLDRSPALFISAGYIIALCLIAALTLGSHRIMVKAVERQRESAEIVYAASRQRVLAQNIAFYAIKYDASHRSEDMDAFENAVFVFDGGHHFLTHIQTPTGEAPRPMSQGLTELYFRPPNNLEQASMDYVAVAHRYAKLANDDPQRPIAFKQVTELGLGPLTEMLDKAVYLYQDDTLQEFTRLTKVQESLTFAVIVVLFVEAGLIFAPLVSYVTKYSRLLLDMALKDPLTGINNRRAFMDQMATELLRHDRHRQPFCVVMADIDKFKSVNDTYGHAVGDKVIQQFAAIAKRALRGADVIGRIGGEEFAFLLLDAGSKKGLQSIERFRRVIEKTPCRYKRDDGTVGTLNFTSSFGIVAVGPEGGKLDDLLKQADDALYRAKHAGRNCVVLANPALSDIAETGMENRDLAPPDLAVAAE